MTGSDNQVATIAEFGTSPQDIVKRWSAELRHAGKQREKFYQDAAKLEKRYENHDERGTTYSKFAVFWSNVEILKPAVYAKAPKIVVTRRFDDDDPVARTAARILERAGNFDIESHHDFNDSLDPAALEYLIVGQGTVWNRFEAKVGDESIQISANLSPSPFPSISQERAPVDLVAWDHFLCAASRTWEETRWVARCVEYTREEGERRFDESLKRYGQSFKDVPFERGPKNNDRWEKTDNEDFLKRALVWEIWDKDTGMVYWIVRNYEFPLDFRRDPLGLKDFFPCPKPLLATLRPRSIIPKADYLFYQDQAQELNEVTAKLACLTNALQVIGMYDGSQAELQDMLKPNMNNRMVPVRSWGALADKGGIKGVVDFWPLDRVMETITALEARRQVLLEIIYQITGIADIIRGASNPNETLGAQQIKSKFAGLRLETRKQKMGEFAGQAAAIKIEIIAKHFRPETIMKMASVEQMGEDQELIFQAMELIKSEPGFCYRIEASVDTMVQLDMDNEKAEKVEFLGAISNFIREASTATQGQPALAPLFMEMLKFGVRGFRVGRELESKVDKTTQYLLNKLKEQEANPPPPKPTPEEVKVIVADKDNATKIRLKEMELAKPVEQPPVEDHTSELLRQDLDIERKLLQADFDKKQAKLAADAEAMQAAEKLARVELESRFKELELKIREVAQEAVIAQTTAEAAEPAESVEAPEAATAAMQASLLQIHQEGQQALLTALEALTAAKNKRIEITAPSGAVYTGVVNG
jgi:hypothetical protein